MQKIRERNKLIDVEKIKSLCEQKGIPFAEFGRRIGLPNRESISRRLLNQNTITADEVFLMADELGVPVEELRAA
jgi:transcriptional regulator with XRE-family HTH domain